MCARGPFNQNNCKYAFPEDIKTMDVRTLSLVQYTITSQPLHIFRLSNITFVEMKVSRSRNAVTDSEPYTDAGDLQFFAVATAFALVLATTVASKAVDTAGQPVRWFAVISWAD
jgi:hypothetical protein